MRTSRVARLPQVPLCYMNIDGLLANRIENNSVVILQEFNLKFLYFRISSDYIIIPEGWWVFVGSFIVGTQPPSL